MLLSGFTNIQNASEWVPSFTRIIATKPQWEVGAKAAISLKSKRAAPAAAAPPSKAWTLDAGGGTLAAVLEGVSSVYLIEGDACTLNLQVHGLSTLNIQYACESFVRLIPNAVWHDCRQSSIVVDSRMSVAVSVDQRTLHFSSTR